MNKNIIAIGILVLFLTGIGTYIYYLNSKILEIGYVRTGVVVEKYKGMIDSKRNLEKKMQQWEASVDTMSFNYQKSLGSFNDHFNTLSKQERIARKNILEAQSNNMQLYISSIEKKAINENQKLTQGILDQINNYIKKFSEQHKYDLILGVTTNGNIMYGAEGIDVTDEIVEGLNKEYSNK